MNTIEIDFDVYKALTVRRMNESMTYNDVLRELLGLGAVVNQDQPSRAEGSEFASGDWVVKGVRFPVGTEFRSTHKGQMVTGVVQAGGLLLRGKRYETPSSAAMSITETSVNGWIFWECKLPGKPWQLIKSLRK
jgi:hypothetical protein